MFLLCLFTPSLHANDILPSFSHPKRNNAILWLCQCIHGKYSKECCLFSGPMESILPYLTCRLCNELLISIVLIIVSPKEFEHISASGFSRVQTPAPLWIIESYGTHHWDIYVQKNTSWECPFDISQNAFGSLPVLLARFFTILIMLIHHIGWVWTRTNYKRHQAANNLSVWYVTMWACRNLRVEALLHWFAQGVAPERTKSL